MNNDTYQDQFIALGLKIKYYRGLKGLTQAQLAEKIHLSKQQISRIESPNNKNGTTLYTLYTIADALDIDICQLIGSNKSEKMSK